MKKCRTSRRARGGAEQLGDGGVAVGDGQGVGVVAVVGSHVGERAAGKQLTNNLQVAQLAGGEERRGAVMPSFTGGKSLCHGVCVRRPPRRPAKVA